MANQRMTPPAAIPGSRYRALLVGVDDYPVKPLAGCVNDIDEIQRILVDQVGVPIAHVRRLASPRPGAPHRTDVPAQPATQANLREAFAGLARDAQPGERVLVYYSGHGLASAYSHPGDGRLYHRESLVPADVYGGGQPRLVADYEVNAWLGALARRGVAVTVVLDCCHAAGVTRDAGLPALRARTLRLDVDLGWTGPITGDALPPRPATRGDRVDTIRLPRWAQPPVRYQACIVQRPGVDTA